MLMDISKNFQIIPKPKTTELSNELIDFNPNLIRIGTDETLPPEGYRIDISQEQIVISSKDKSGEFYGRQSLEQLVNKSEKSTGVIPTGHIKDWPSIKTRGVMLDISRSKIPTIDELFSIIDLLAVLKYNHLELYTEHTFAYSNHKTVWENSSPYTSEEILQIKAYCTTKMIELTPNQNTLGHMERWLIHDRYKSLGLKIGNVLSPYGLMRPATTIDPENPEARALVRELLGELMPLFDSDKVNIGLDEPFEMESSNHATWGGYLTYLRNLSAVDNKQLLIWSDMLNIYPDLIDYVPDGTTVVEWGYEYNSPFSRNLSRFSEKSLDHWVAPGTSSWLSITGRMSNCLENIRNAVINAEDYGSSGFLNTDWGDFGHLQWWPISLPGIIIGGELSWGGKQRAIAFNIEDLVDAIATIVFKKHKSPRKSAQLLTDVCEINCHISSPFPNLSILALSLYLPQLHVGSGLTTNLTEQEVKECLGSIEDIAVGLNSTESDDTTIQLRSSVKLMKTVLADNLFRLQGTGHVKDLSSNNRKFLSTAIDEVIEEHRTFWSRYFRPGGMTESLEWLNHIKETYDSGFADPAWSGPLKCLHSAQS